jgi:hypothetical protein
MTKKEQTSPQAAAMVNWLQTEEGRRHLARAIQQSREAAERLEEARKPDPKSMREPFTL